MVVISEGIFCKRHSKRQHVLTFVLGLVGIIFESYPGFSPKFNVNDATIVRVRRSTLKDTLPRALDWYFQDWPLDHKLPKKGVPALCFGVIIVNGSSCMWKKTNRRSSPQCSELLHWELDHDEKNWIPFQRDGETYVVGTPVTSCMQSFTLFRNSGATKRVGDDVFFSLHGKINMEPRHVQWEKVKHQFLDSMLVFEDGSVGETKSASKRFLLLPGVSFIPANMAKHRHFGSDEPPPKNYFFFHHHEFWDCNFFFKVASLYNSMALFCLGAVWSKDGNFRLTMMGTSRWRLI